jgi:CHAT domain-containing protein/Tfp pilus assembly protein PilF
MNLRLTIALFSIAVGLSAFSPCQTTNSDPGRPTLGHGIVVESVSKHSEAEKAGIQPDDVLLSWARSQTEGEINSPFDLPYLRFEYGSRGPVLIKGLRGLEQRTWVLGSDTWGISARPNFSDPLLHSYLRGKQLAASGNLIQAAEFWQSVLPEARKYDNPWLSSWFLSRAGWVLFDAKEWDSYDMAYREAIQEAVRAGPVARAEILRQWAERHEYQDDLANAEKHYSEVLVEWEILGHDTMTVANTVLHLAVVDLKRDEFDKAEGHLNRALSLAQVMAPASVQTTLILSNLGVLFEDRGDLAKAEDYYLKGLAIEEKYFPDTLDLAHVLTAVGTLAHQRGDLARAEAYHRRALGIAEKLDTMTPYVVDILRNLGECVLDRGDTRSAEKYQKRALELAQKIAPESLLPTYSYASLGRVARIRGDLVNAEFYYNQALALARKKEAPPQEMAELLIGQADVLRDLGAFARAETLYRDGLDILEKVNPGGIDRAEAVASLASTLHHQGRIESAALLFRQALSALENRTFQLGGIDEDRSHYRAWYVRYYQEYMELLVGQGRLEQAFELLDGSRARTLLEMLAQAHVQIDKGVDLGALHAERKVQELLHAKSESRVRLASGPHTDAQLAKADAEVGELLFQHQQLDAQLRSNSPKYSALVQPRVLSLKEIQELLDDNTLLLEYALGEDHSYVWAVTKTALSVHELPSRAEIERLARAIHELLNFPSHLLQSETDVQASARRARVELQYAKTSADLSQMILGPIADLLRDRRLLIVSDGALRYVPFAALPVPKAANLSTATQRRYLILDHEIVNLPSASIVAELRREQIGRQPPLLEVAIFADPVFDSSDERVSTKAAFPGPAHQTETARNPSLQPTTSANERLTRSLSDFEMSRGSSGFRLNRLLYTRQEAAAIMSVTPRGRAMEALDFFATRKTAMSSTMARYRIVHFATHGLLNSEHPELSGLVLSLVDKAGQPQAGFLELQDIYNLNLPVDLVVLSACDTGLGQEVKGEGLIGLTRGFMYAGASRVVASLWSVDDIATSELMAHFYKAMQQSGLRPAAALRAAQIQMLHQERRKSPFYWAAFQIHGEWR